MFKTILFVFFCIIVILVSYCTSNDDNSFLVQSTTSFNSSTNPSQSNTSFTSNTSFSTTNSSSNSKRYLYVFNQNGPSNPDCGKIARIDLVNDTVNSSWVSLPQNAGDSGNNLTNNMIYNNNKLYVSRSNSMYTIKTSDISYTSHSLLFSKTKSVPQGISINSYGLFVVRNDTDNAGTGDLLKLDNSFILTNSVSLTDTYPSGIVFSNNKLYVISGIVYSGGHISIVNPDTFVVTSSNITNVPLNPDGMAIDSSDNVYYNGGNVVGKINPLTDSITEAIIPSSSYYGLSIAIGSNNIGYLSLTDFTISQVIKFDSDTLTLSNSISNLLFSGSYSANMLACSNNGNNYVYVSGGFYGKDVRVINMNNDSVVKTYNISANLGWSGLAYEETNEK